jgi:hypothetical protein
MEGGYAMEGMNRRKFLKTTGKLTLAGTAALSIGPAISTVVPYPLKLAFASSSQSEFNLYNGVNPNAKEMVTHTFKDCISQDLAPTIIYKTSKPMVAVANGTVVEVSKMEELGNYYKGLRIEKNDAKGYLAKVIHGSTFVSLYVHLKMPEVKSRQKVKRGEIIGYPDERWNMPRLALIESWESADPNNYGVNHSFMTYWDGSTDFEIDKDEQNKRYEIQQKILNNIGGMAEGSEKYTLLRKKHKGVVLYKWSNIEKFRYIHYLYKNKPETFPSLTKEQYGEMKKEFYRNQAIILTLPFKKG